MSKRTYLGDAVYASFDGYYLWLTTEDGITTTNRIALEPRVLEALFDFVGILRDSKQEVES